MAAESPDNRSSTSSCIDEALGKDKDNGGSKEVVGSSSSNREAPTAEDNGVGDAGTRVLDNGKVSDAGNGSMSSSAREGEAPSTESGSIYEGTVALDFEEVAGVGSSSIILSNKGPSCSSAVVY